MKGLTDTQKDDVFLGIIQLNPNVAVKGMATQSTTHIFEPYAASPLIASYANDGNFDTRLNETSGACAETRITPPVWWQVDLFEVYEIMKVAITGRQRWCKC